MEKNDIALGLILALLFESFPKKVDIGRSSVDKEYFPDDEYFESIVFWLKDEGYLRFDRAAGDEEIFFINVVLSEKGLRTLRSPPKEISAYKSLGASLVGSSREIATDVAKSQIASAIGEMLGGFVSNLAK